MTRVCIYIYVYIYVACGLRDSRLQRYEESAVVGKLEWWFIYRLLAIHNHYIGDEDKVLLNAASDNSLSERSVRLSFTLEATFGWLFCLFSTWQTVMRWRHQPAIL